MTVPFLVWSQQKRMRDRKRERGGKEKGEKGMKGRDKGRRLESKVSGVSKAC